MIRQINQAKKGNKEAYAAIFKEYEKDIYRMAYIYVKNKHDALDVVQETAYCSFKTIKNLKHPKYFKTWIIRIAIHCSLDFLREKNRTVQLLPEVQENFTEDINDYIDLKITVRDLINQLNEGEKSVILLKYYQDFTFKEIAKILEIPLGTTKTICYRAQAKLRNNLKGDEKDE